MIPIKTRGFFLREFKRCFIGKEAVLWMVAAGFAADPMHAMRIGNGMIHSGIIRHVTDVPHLQPRHFVRVSVSNSAGYALQG